MTRTVDNEFTFELKKVQVYGVKIQDIPIEEATNLRYATVLFEQIPVHTKLWKGIRQLRCHLK